MTDQPKTPPQDTKSPEQVKDAVPDGSFSKPPEAKKLTFGQQLFVWTMIAVVGLLFGVGASAGIITEPPRTIAGVSEAEVIPRMRVAERLEKVLNPRGGWRTKFAAPRYGGNQLEIYASNLTMARAAEARGLMPKGRALDRIEAEFLGTRMDDSPTLTYRDALIEHEGGADQVTREDLRRFLQERAALDGLRTRAAIAPAIPRSLGDDLAAAQRDRIDLVEVSLSGLQFVPQVAADDPEIATAFERLRTTRFQRPAGVALTIGLADRDALGAKIDITEAEAKVYYDAHQDEFRAEKDPATPDKAAPVRPFDQVKEAASAKVRAARGSAAAQAIAIKLDAREDLDGDKDPAAFQAAMKEAGLVPTDLSVEDRTPGTVDLGKLGTVKDVMHLFGHEHEPGFVSRAMQTSAGHWVVLRLNGRREAGFQELAQVRDEVVRHVAGRRAYKKMVEEAGKIGESLKGPGALAAWAASDAAKSWHAQLATKPSSLIARLPVPAPEADAQAGDPLLLAPLAMPDRRVAVAAAEPAWDGDVPRIRLIQAGELKPGKGDDADRPLIAEYMRGMLGEYSATVFSRELSQQMEQR